MLELQYFFYILEHLLGWCLGIGGDFSLKVRAMDSWIPDHVRICWPCTAFSQHKEAALEKKPEQSFSVAHEMLIWLETELKYFWSLVLAISVFLEAYL